MSLIKRYIARLLRIWSYIVFPHLKRFQSLQQGLDRIILGGYGASKYYQMKSGIESGDADLTVVPSSISYMYRIIKNYHSYLKKHGEIVLVIHPFCLCINRYQNNNQIAKDIRYYPVLHNAMIDYFDKNIHEKWSNGGKASSLLYSIGLVLGRYSERKEISEIKKNISNAIESDGVLNNALIETINTNVSILRSLKSFCEERGYKCKIMIMDNIPSINELCKNSSIITKVLYEPLQHTNITVEDL